MINSENLCMSCMREIGDAEQCPYCGYHADTPQISPYLPVRTVVGNRYLVGKLLEYNGDGATYIAWDINGQKPVKIREFLPDTLCSRKSGDKHVSIMSGCEITFNDCMLDFLELWRKLTRMSGLSALENVYEVFEENLTAYAICEYVESISLRDYLLRNKAGYISWERARSLFMPVLSTLGMLHTSGIIHRGVSPVTLQIGRDGKMRLSGFSIWQARTARGDLTAQLFPGYAAVEQYGFEGKQGSWTDIYSFAATLYRALIGSDPVEATERLTNDKLMVPGKFAEQLPAYVINGLINALQILPEDRTRSVEQLRAELSASPSATVSGELGGISAPAPSAKKEPSRNPAERTTVQKKPAKKEGNLSQNKLLIIKTTLISAIVCLLVFLVVVLVAGDKLGLSTEEPETEATTSSELVVVPYLVERNYSEVMATPFWTNDFTFEKIEEYSDTVLKGNIISQSIDANTKVNAGTKIVLTVSLGLEQFELPNVIGMDYDDAKDMLKSRNFTVSREKVENDGSHTEGEVHAVVNLVVGKSYPKGTKVTLQVWDAAPTQPPIQLPNEENSTDSVETSGIGGQLTPDVPDAPPAEEPTVEEPGGELEET